MHSVIQAAAQGLRRAKVSFGHGTTNADDEAVWLVLHALRLPFEALEAELDRELTASEARRTRALIDRRIRTRKPAAYLTHEAWLGEHRFYVDERVLVPRSYIAELLRADVAPWIPDASRVRTALDLCTGSGCLAILASLSFPRARVDAADISKEALEVARKNVAMYRLERRVRLVRSDLFGSLDKRYDVIISNPPYVTATSMRKLPAEYRSEPRLALAGGCNGLDLVRHIVEEAPSHLNPGGVLVVEVGHNRKRVEKAYPRVPFTWADTSGGDDCVLVVTREELLRALSQAARSPRARRAGASPRLRGARSPARA